MAKSIDIATSQPEGGFFMQPDSVPFSVFNEKLSEVQENVFTVAAAAFSRHLINLGDLTGDGMRLPEIIDIKRVLVENGFLTDKAHNLVIGIDPHEVMPKYTSPALVREACLRLSRILVRFKIDSWYGMRKMEATQVLFTGIVAPEELSDSADGRIYVSLNNWAIPYFLFYGAYDIYFGKVQKDIALSLKGQTNKRLYKMICSMYGKKGNRCEMPVSELRKMLNLAGEVRQKNTASEDGPDFYITGKRNYRRADKIRRVLDKSRQAIEESGSDYWFDYELLSRQRNGKRGRQRMDTVAFTVHNRAKDADAKAPSDHRLFESLSDLFRLYADHDVIPYIGVAEAAGKVLEAGAAELVLKKHAYYMEKLPRTDPDDPDARALRDKRIRHEFNIIHKILKEDYDIMLNVNARHKKNN